MSLTVKHLNADTTFLLTFAPESAPLSSPGLFPGSFTILIDPWITGASKIISPIISISTHTVPACIRSLKEIAEPDVVLISQDKPDHCHEETLCQLPPDTKSLIVATSGAARTIRSWRHFQTDAIISLKRYDPKDDRTVFRMDIPPPSPNGTAGEVTIALIPERLDVTGVHTAIGITYRPPATALTVRTGSYVELPLSPPASPLPLPSSSSTSTSTSSKSPRLVPIAPTRSTITPSPYHDREKTLSVIYSPHGVAYPLVQKYASSHLVQEAALPLTALLHSFDRVINPWYLGGTIVTGLPGGLEIATNLFAKAWIGAHDEDKQNKGISTRQLKTKKWGVGEIQILVEERLRADCSGSPKRADEKGRMTVVSLSPGEELRIS